MPDIPGDYYYFEEEKVQNGRRAYRKSYKSRMNRIRITVSAVDKLTKTIDFTVYEDYELSDGDSEMLMAILEIKP